MSGYRLSAGDTATLHRMCEEYFGRHSEEMEAVMVSRRTEKELSVLEVRVRELDERMRHETFRREGLAALAPFTRTPSAPDPDPVSDHGGHRTPILPRLLPSGPGRHGIRWTWVAWCRVSGLWMASQALLTAGTAAEVLLRATLATAAFYSAFFFAHRLYRRPEDR